MKEELPSKSDAIEVLRNEADFFRFQKIWQNRKQYMKPIEQKTIKEYDEIKMIPNE